MRVRLAPEALYRRSTPTTASRSAGALPPDRKALSFQLVMEAGVKCHRK